MMVVDQQTREKIAGMLLGAYSSRKPVEPLTGQYDLTAEDAYEIQLLQVGRWVADQRLEDRPGRHHRRQRLLGRGGAGQQLGRRVLGRPSAGWVQPVQER